MASKNVTVKFNRIGVGISNTDVEYADSTSSSTAPTSGWQTNAPAWQNGHYIWTRTHIYYTDKNEKLSEPVCLPSGKGVAKIEEWYYLSSSTTSLAGGSWVKDKAPTWKNGYYIWTKSVITYTDGTNTSTSPICTAGNKGDKGDKGDKGNQGDKGEQGNKGDKGEKGDQGNKGDKGDKGEKGDQGNKGDKGEKGDKGNQGERGPALRGPQAWSDCAVGYVFQSGASGEEYKDIVLYDGSFYSCIKQHAKTASNYPGGATATNSGLWRLAQSVEMVATKILLAQYALVKNLGVETIDMKDAKGNIIFQAKDGDVICNKGTFNSIKVTGDSEFSGMMKGVRGSFKSLDCVDNNDNIVGSITFDSYGRMWFDGDMYSQGYNSKQGRSNRFYTSDVWCRGMFGHYEKTMAVVKGDYMMVYTKGIEKSGVYVALTRGKTTDNETYYEIPLYSPGNNDTSGMPIDVVVFNTTSDNYYAFTKMGNGKEWRVVNGNDDQTVHFCDIGGWHELVGGESTYCVYVNPEWLNPVPDKDAIGRGVFWSGERDLNW